MCDGSKQNNGVHLNVYAFSHSDLQVLILALNKMGLKCSIHKHAKGPRIYIWGESMPLLCQLVEPYMHPSMLYKLSK